MPCDEKSFWTKTFNDLLKKIVWMNDANRLGTFLFDRCYPHLAGKLSEEGNGIKISDVSFKLFEKFFFDKLWDKKPVHQYANVIKEALEDMDRAEDFPLLHKLQKLVKVRFETIIDPNPTPFPGRFTPNLTLCCSTVIVSKQSNNDQVSLTYLEKETLYYNPTPPHLKVFSLQILKIIKPKKDQKSLDKENQLDLCVHTAKTATFVTCHAVSPAFQVADKALLDANQAQTPTAF